MAERIVDVLIPLIIEEIVEIVKAIFQERISERIREQIVDVHVPGVVEQVTEVPKTSNRDRTLQHAVEQILDVPLPEMVTQLVEVPNTVSQDRIKQRTVEHISETPVPQAVEELAEISRVFSQDGIQQRATEQTTPAIALVEKIVEMPVIRKTQQVANTHVQHVINAVEAEMPRIIKETVQRKRPVVSEKINQMTKHPEVPQVHVVEKTVERSQLQIVEQIDVIPEIRTDVGTQTSEKAVGTPQLHVVEKIVDIFQFQTGQSTQTFESLGTTPVCQLTQAVDIPVVAQRQTPQVQVSEKTVEISQLQAIEKIVETSETQTIQGARTSERSGTAPGVEEVHATGVVKPDDTDAKIKFFTEEALHGVGSPVFDANGNRVANELGKRDCVTGEMWENNAVSDDRQCKHYTGRGVRKLHESGTALAEDMGVPVSKTPDSIEAHYQASLKTARNPNGEPHPAFTSDKSWDEASGKTVAHRQVPLIQRVQKTVEVPRVQFIDRLVDDPAVMRREAFNIEARELIEDNPVGAKQQESERPLSPKKRRLPVETESGFQSGEQSDLDAESNHERFKDLVLPSSQSCLCVSIASSDEGEVEAGDGSTEEWTEVKKRGRKKPTKKSTASGGGEEEELKQQAEATSLVQGREHRREEDETDAQVPGSELVQVAPNMVAGGSHPRPRLTRNGTKSCARSVGWSSFWCTGKENSTSGRTWQPVERESSQLEDEERETSLEGALTDRTKVVKLTVDKWFVDKGYGCGKALTGEVVFIHASAVQGAEVLISVCG